MLERIDFGAIFKGGVAGIGALVSYFYGGWSLLLQVLLALVVIDYITGIIASGVESKLSSSIGLKGITKKVFIFVMVAVAHLVDAALGNSGSILMDATIFFYIANELLSIVENAGRVGLPVPGILKQAVEILKGKSQPKEGK